MFSDGTFCMRILITSQLNLSVSKAGYTRQCTKRRKIRADHFLGKARSFLLSRMSAVSEMLKNT